MPTCIKATCTLPAEPTPLAHVPSPFSHAWQAKLPLACPFFLHLHAYMDSLFSFNKNTVETESWRRLSHLEPSLCQTVSFLPLKERWSKSLRSRRDGAVNLQRKENIKERGGRKKEMGGGAKKKQLAIETGDKKKTSTESLLCMISREHKNPSTEDLSAWSKKKTIKHASDFPLIFGPGHPKQHQRRGVLNWS